MFIFFSSLVPLLEKLYHLFGIDFPLIHLFCLLLCAGTDINVIIEFRKNSWKQSFITQMTAKNK